MGRGMGRGRGCCCGEADEAFGEAASRGCSDFWCLPVWGLAVLLQVAVGWVAVHNGHPRQLIYGVDYQGDLCGSSDQFDSPNLALQSGWVSSDWSEYRYLWFPIDLSKLVGRNGDLIEGASDVWSSALHNAVCVKQCPQKGDTVYTYGARPAGSDEGAVPSSYTAEYDSSPTLHRCLPLSVPTLVPPGVGSKQLTMRTELVTWEEREIDRSTYQGFAQPRGAVNRAAVGYDSGLGAWLCTSPSSVCVNVPEGTDGSVADKSACEQQCAAQQGASVLAMNIATQTTADLYVCLNIVGYTALVALACGALWLVLVRFCAYKVVMFSLLMVFSLIGGVGYVVFKHAPNAGTPKYWFWASYGIWGVDGLLMLFFLIFRKTLRVACQVVMESTKIVLSSPTTLLIPVGTALVSAAFTVGMALIYVYVQSMKRADIPSELNLIDYGNSTEWLQHHSHRTIEFMYWWNLFFYFWGSCFIADFAFMTLAVMGVFWYYSAKSETVQEAAGVPVEEIQSKSAPTMFKSICVVMCHHLGTLAVGSFILALVKYIRAIFLHLKKTIEKHLGKRAAGVVICCIECLLWCLEKVIEAVSKRAYILTAINGGSFFPNAWTALMLMMSNAVLVSTTSFIEASMEVIGKLLITGVGLVFCYFCLFQWDLAPDDVQPYGAFIGCGVAAYIIAGIFMNVFDTVTSTLLMTFIHDQDDPDDGDEYMPDSLREIVGSISRHGSERPVFRSGDLLRPRRPREGLRLGKQGEVRLTDKSAVPLSEATFPVVTTDPELTVSHEGQELVYRPQFNSGRSGEYAFHKDGQGRGCKWYDPLLIIIFPIRLVLCMITCGVVKCFNPFSDDDDDEADEGEKEPLLPSNVHA